jgi:hypothetical protein
MSDIRLTRKVEKKLIKVKNWKRQEFLKNINLNDSGGIPPYFRNSGGNSGKIAGILTKPAKSLRYQWCVPALYLISMTIYRPFNDKKGSSRSRHKMGHLPSLARRNTKSIITVNG